MLESLRDISNRKSFSVQFPSMLPTNFFAYLNTLLEHPELIDVENVIRSNNLVDVKNKVKEPNVSFTDYIDNNWFDLPAPVLFFDFSEGYFDFNIAYGCLVCRVLPNIHMAVVFNRNHNYGEWSVNPIITVYTTVKPFTEIKLTAEAHWELDSIFMAGSAKHLAGIDGHYGYCWLCPIPQDESVVDNYFTFADVVTMTAYQIIGDAQFLAALKNG